MSNAMWGGREGGRRSQCLKVVISIVDSPANTAVFKQHRCPGDMTFYVGVGSQVLTRDLVTTPVSCSGAYQVSVQISSATCNTR